VPHWKPGAATVSGFELVIGFVEAIGRAVTDVLEQAGRTAMLFSKAIATLRRPPYYIHECFEQMLDVGVRSLPIVLVTAMFSGAVFALQTWEGFERYGTTSFVGPVVALALTREMVPVLASLMVSGRAGSAMAAEIGTMVVTEQVDALRAMAVDPVEYLVVPRVIATAIMLPLTVLIGDLLGLWGGSLVVINLYGSGPATYWDGIWQVLTVKDINSGLAKACVFGVLIALFGCQNGFHTSGGAQGVGRATTRAVVSGSMAILISNFFLTKLLLE
jgi:phospholipid/cholesterol/gamma-HCH transport system permease protein